MVVGEKLHIDPPDRRVKLIEPDGRAAAGVDQEFWSPASTNVEGPNRCGLGIGTPVPSNVTLKSLLIVEL